MLTVGLGSIKPKTAAPMSFLHEPNICAIVCYTLKIHSDETWPTLPHRTLTIVAPPAQPGQEQLFDVGFGA